MRVSCVDINESRPKCFLPSWIFPNLVWLILYDILPVFMAVLIPLLLSPFSFHFDDTSWPFLSLGCCWLQFNFEFLDLTRPIECDSCRVNQSRLQNIVSVSTSQCFSSLFSFIHCISSPPFPPPHAGSVVYWILYLIWQFIINQFRVIPSSFKN